MFDYRIIKYFLFFLFTKDVPQYLAHLCRRYNLRGQQNYTDDKRNQNNLDMSLNWKVHIDASDRYVIRRIKDKYGTSTVETANFAFTEPPMRYGMLVREATISTNLERVLSPQKRVIAGLSLQSSYQPAFQD